ncbi:Gfo/Idh/MocA family protein [Paenibacillus cremeus]|uniref:Gfo/Idh/MocA family oxidoreductase n=1 Tax=Paenibacillus cremeus TaxID=2163881 RepID=A0A559K8X1_9BACL|nr:Gfo/Idh/MocA family oxidoreductase [Paenibacillus cremeus]TVY08572.1 Gfo/Idh/MocA family oxidoreductase [Paenibacillus cremeus]
MPGSESKPGKMRFAIVGAGVISPFHARAIKENPEAELVAICDVLPEQAQKLAAEHAPNAQTYTDYEAMLKRDDIDAVCVTVPSGFHGDVAIAAAQAGKHVLCEKPLDITSSKMTEMIDACRSRNLKLGCIYQRRVTESTMLAKKAIDEGKLGKLVMGDVYQKYYRSPEYYRSAGWRGTLAIDGGGALMNQGVHGIDQIVWLMGDVHSVFAYSAPLIREIEVEDTAVAVVRYKNGAFGVIQGTTSVYPSQQARCEIHGEKGTIVFSENGFTQWKFMDSDEPIPAVKPRARSNSGDPKDIPNDGHFILLDDFIRAVREDRDPLITGEEARKAVDLILAIYESSRTGKEVLLQPNN